MRKQLERLFKPKAIAVIGGTERESSPGYFFMKNLVEGGFSGQVIPVNPKHKRVWGETCYPSVAKIPVTIDLAIVCTPMRTVLKIVEECGQARVGGVVINTSPDPSLPDSDKLNAALAALVRKYQIRILGPESLGFINNQLGLNATMSIQTALPGNLAFITQSGSLGVSVLDWAVEHRIGFSHFMALGETVDIGFDDLIDYLGADTQTSCILLYLEQLTKARRFMSAARAFARSKPIIALKAGRGQTDAAFDAAFRRAGIIRVDTVAQLFNCAHSLALQPRPVGNRLAVITNADGPGALAADYLVSNGGLLAPLSPTTRDHLTQLLPQARSLDNPINIYGMDAPEQYSQALEACLSDENVDGALVVLTPMAMTQSSSVAHAISEIAHSARKPVLASWMGEHHVLEARSWLESKRIPHYRFPESAVDTFLKMYRHHRNLQLLQEAPPAEPPAFVPDRETAGKLLATARAKGHTLLTEEETLAWLQCYQIPVAEKTATGDFQLLLGVEKNDVFGPMVCFGRGGSGAYIDRDWQLGLPPLNITLARRVIENTRIFPLLASHGKSPGAMLGFLEELLCKLSYLVMDFPEVLRIEINPFLLHANGGGAQSAVMELESADFRRSLHPYDHLVISPYPAQYQRTIRLKDGREVLLRPIRPEDEQLEINMFSVLSRETLYFRFFGYVPKLTHEFLARFTQIDYDREMAIIAELEEDGEKKMIGVVRIIADAWKESAEYAIVVADPWHGLGLGSYLTNFILEIARDMGLERITANVLSTNKSMLRLFERKGFTIRREDFEVYAAELVLEPPK